jgi:Protein of unknown function (DUF2905)
MDSSMGRALVVAGVVLVLVGLAVMLGGRIPGLGRLPGDIVVRRGNFAFHFPIVTCLLVSLLLTLLFSLFRRH